MLRFLQSQFSSTASLLEEFTENYDDLEAVCDFFEPTASLPRDTTPVALGTVPEYFNFWQGKPLKLRDWRVPQHGRKSSARPKSDYGSRYYSSKSGKSTQDGGMRDEGTEGEDGLNLDDVMGLGGKGGQDGKDVSLAALFTLYFLFLCTQSWIDAFSERYGFL